MYSGLSSPEGGISTKGLCRAFQSLSLLGKEGVRLLGTYDAFESEMVILTTSAAVGFSEVNAEMGFGAQVFLRRNTWGECGGSRCAEGGVGL